VENPERVLGVLAGGDIDTELLRRWASSADRVIAADAGADLLFHISIAPDLVIGDMDSVSVDALHAAKMHERISEQDTTDCDKLLAAAKKDGLSAITLMGVEGDLPDHVLATLHSAARSPLDVRLAYRRGIGWVAKPDRPLVVRTRPGTRVSLLAIDPCDAVHFTGVKWPLSNSLLSLEHGTSISNQTVGDEVSVTIGNGAALLFLEVPTDELPIW
jgi:thiamine pyrophosphokinase